MKRCLSERGLLRVSTGEGASAEQIHLWLCADCAERYDALTNDLQAIGDVLVQAPPRGLMTSRAATVLVRWVPAAAAAMVLLGVGLAVTRLLTPAPVQVAAARSETVSAFAADVSEALFATDDTSDGAQIAFDAPYLQAALDAGLPCTREGFANGQCNDEVSGLVFESE
jgi:hypothetical protein